MSNRVINIRNSDERKIIDKLHRLSLKIQRDYGIKYRVKFVALAFKHGLVEAIGSYQLWDEGWQGLGSRAFDTCFEMGDAEAVIAMVVTQAKSEGFLDAIRNFCNTQDTYERWLGYADKQ